MKRNTPLTVLMTIFLLRLMFPVTNAAYFLSELTLSKDGLWHTLYIVSLLCEVAALMVLAMGVNDPKCRRIGAYAAFGLPGLHYAVTLIAFIILPPARHFIGFVFMGVLTAVYLLTAGMGYLTLRSADDMPPYERKPLSIREIDKRMEKTLEN